MTRCRHDQQISVTGEPARVQYHATCDTCGLHVTFPQAPFQTLPAEEWHRKLMPAARQALKRARAEGPR